MSHASRSDEPLFFARAEDFRAWLAKNSETAAVLIVGFYKVGSGRQSMTWPESVDEALGAGWIDGVRKRIDDHAYQIRFTPRKKGSVWSAVNIARAEELIAEGRMKPAGGKAYEQRTERKSSIYSYEQKGALELASGELASFKKNRAAWAFFQKTAPSYRRTMVYWVVSAQRPATRARRLAKLIEHCTMGVRLMP